MSHFFYPQFLNSKDGLMVGPGAIVASLEYSCGISAKVIGKSSAEYFERVRAGKL